MFSSFEHSLYKHRNTTNTELYTSKNHTYKNLHLLHQLKLIQVDEMNKKKNDFIQNKSRIIKEIDSLSEDEIKQRIKNILLNEKFEFVSVHIEDLWGKGSCSGVMLDIDYSVLNILHESEKERIEKVGLSDSIHSIFECGYDFYLKSKYSFDEESETFSKIDVEEINDLENTKIYNTIFKMSTQKYNSLRKKCDITNETNSFKYYDYINQYIIKDFQ